MLPCPAGWDGLVEAEELETLEVLLQQDVLVGGWVLVLASLCPSLLWAIEIGLDWRGGEDPIPSVVPRN